MASRSFLIAISTAALAAVLSCGKPHEESISVDAIAEIYGDIGRTIRPDVDSEGEIRLDNEGKDGADITVYIDREEAHRYRWQDSKLMNRDDGTAPTGGEYGPPLGAVMRHAATSYPEICTTVPQRYVLRRYDDKRVLMIQLRNDYATHISFTFDDSGTITHVSPGR